VDGFILIDSSKEVVDEILKSQKRKEVINNLAQTALVVTGCVAFHAIYPPTVAVPMKAALFAGILTSGAGEYLKHAIERSL